MMQSASERFAASMGDIRLQSPRAPYLSNLTGSWIKAEEATSPDYWANHLRHTVRFSANVQELLKLPANHAFLEVGPGQTLGALTRRGLARREGRLVLSSMRWPQQEVSDVEFLLTSLGRLWLAGVEVSWHDFHSAESRRRVALPTYPFERQRYWIEAPRKDYEALANPLHRNPNIDEWFFAPSWKQTLPRAGVVTESQKWLLFLDDCGLGEGVESVLSKLPQEVATVRKGDCFRRLGVTSYEIDPRRPDDYYALLKELQERGQFPDSIVYLWAVTADDCRAPTVETFDEIQETVFSSLLRLTQALAAVKAPTRAQLCVVSNGMQMVTGGEASRPEKATLLGLCKVIPQELPNITCRSLDVTLPAAGESLGRLSKLMAAELLASAAEPVVAYRGGQRWAQTFESAPVLTGAPGGVQIKEGGVYLITGGLGKIGLLLATHIAETPGVRLVLVGRSIPPVREDWETGPATGQAYDEMAQKLRALREIKALGAEVVVAEADVADRRRMQSVLDDVRARFGRLDGVIHAAGLVGESWLRPIKETDWRLVEAHFRPKAHGLLALDELLRDFSPDFCILVSSLSSILGGVGYAAYASANSFMDALAQGRSVKDGLPWMSVNWDGWQAQDGPEDEVATARATQLGIVMREGVRAFARLLPLTGMAPQLAVSTADLNARIRRFAGRRERASAAHKTTGEVAAPARPQAGVRGDYVAPASELERSLAEVWEDALGVERIGVHDNFFELGGDSLLATQILPQISENLQVELKLRDIFESPTIAGLASLVVRRLQEREDAHEAEILKMIEHLSEREIEAELNRRTQTAEIK
jgi:acyl transferase domain-containing protein